MFCEQKNQRNQFAISGLRRHRAWAATRQQELWFG